MIPKGLPVIRDKSFTMKAFFAFSPPGAGCRRFRAGRRMLFAGRRSFGSDTADGLLVRARLTIAPLGANDAGREGETMTRIWHKDAGPLLIAFLLIDVAIFAYTETIGARLNSGTDLTAQQVGWAVLDAFLSWRIWRGGRMAWSVLFGINILILALMLTAQAAWSDYASVLYVFVTAQILILLTPAVRHHASRGQRH
jgi:hypothetical protein